jgi:hypothetical protein
MSGSDLHQELSGLAALHDELGVDTTEQQLQILGQVSQPMGVFVTREHVRHNKSGIAHRGRTGINHLRELPTKLNHFCSGGQVTLPNRTREPQVCLWSAGVPLECVDPVLTDCLQDPG